MSANVTARPWKCERGWLRGAGNERIAEFFSHPNFDDQQFLVLAVNSHDELVAALKGVLDWYGGPTAHPEEWSPCMRAAAAALAKAAPVTA